MTWLRIDDCMPDHPKVDGLSDRAFRAHVTGLCYCARHLTDGNVPQTVADRIARQPVLDELKRANLLLDHRRYSAASYHLLCPQQAADRY